MNDMTRKLHVPVLSITDDLQAFHERLFETQGPRRHLNKVHAGIITTNGGTFYSQKAAVLSALAAWISNDGRQFTPRGLVSVGVVSPIIELEILCCASRTSEFGPGAT